MVLLHQRGALHQRLLYRYSASGDDVPDALLEEGPPVSWEHSIVSSIWGCPSMDYIPKISQNIFKLFSGDDLYMICKPLVFLKVHQYIIIVLIIVGRSCVKACIQMAVASCGWFRSTSTCGSHITILTPLFGAWSILELLGGLSDDWGKILHTSRKTQLFPANSKQVNATIRTMLWKPELNSLVNWNVEAGRLGKNWGNTFMMTMVGSTRYVAQDFPGGQQMNDKNCEMTSLCCLFGQRPATPLAPTCPNSRVHFEVLAECVRGTKAEPELIKQYASCCGVFSPTDCQGLCVNVLSCVWS